MPEIEEKVNELENIPGRFIIHIDIAITGLGHNDQLIYRFAYIQ